MESIRVVLAHLPGLLRGILRSAAADTPDVIVLGEIGDLSKVAQLVLETDPHAIILGAVDGAIPQSCSRLLEIRPHLKVVVVAGDGREVVLHRLGHAASTLRDPSPSGILHQVRAAVHAPAPPPR